MEALLLTLARILGLGLVGIGAWLAKKYMDRVDLLGEKLVGAIQDVTTEIHTSSSDLREEMHSAVGSLRKEIHDLAEKMEVSVKDVSKSLSEHKLDVEKRFLPKEEFKTSITRVHERLDGVGTTGRIGLCPPSTPRRRAEDQE